MPLLSDATNCFVGHTQIQQIYAGSNKVWPKGPSLYPSLSAYYMAPPEVTPTGNQPTVLISCAGITCEGLKHCYLYRKTSNPGTDDGYWQETNYGKPISDSPNAKYKVFLTDHTDQFFFDLFYNPSDATKDIAFRIERKIDGKSYMGPQWQFPWPLTLDTTPPGLRTHECDGLENGFSFSDAKTVLSASTGSPRRYYNSSFKASPAKTKTNQEVYDLLDIETAIEGTSTWSAVQFDDITFSRSFDLDIITLSFRTGVKDSTSDINSYLSFRFKNKSESDWYIVEGRN